jgi:hypothetical protein
MTSSTPGLGDIVKPPEDEAVFDLWDPANVSPVVGWLATEGCRATGRVFFIQGGTVRLMNPWTMGDGIEHAHRLTLADLDAGMDGLLLSPSGD